MIYIKEKDSGKYPVAAVGIGPGDPDLITVKGLKTLQEADVIFYPASGKDESSSFSRVIISRHNLKGELAPMVIPMGSKTREDDYLKAFNLIRQAWSEGKKVAIVSEGDIMFYSTFGYLLSHIKEHRIPFLLIPGIPAFVLGASVMSEPLTEGDESLEVIARPASFEQITEVCSRTASVVVMKMSVLKGWPEYLEKQGYKFFYAEKLGTEEQFTTTSIKTLKEREIPYFSIIIIKQQL